VMVTHDVDEALLLSDRVICLTNGPEAGIGQILPVPLPRPRQRLEVMEHPDYYRLRSELIGFLQQQRRLKQRRAAVASAVATTQTSLQAEATPASEPATSSAAANARVPGLSSRRRARGTSSVVPSPTRIRLGYLPGLDIAPLALALEQGLFEASIQVVPVSFARWEVLEEKLMNGELEAAITAATAPLALSLGLSGRAPWPAITPMTVSRNGNALCLHRHLLNLGIRDLTSLAEWVQGRDKPLTIAVPQRHGTAELLLRHWFVRGGICLDTQVRFEPMSPMVMHGALRNEQIDGFIAGRYRVAEAVEDRQGYVLATDLDIWSGHPEKVLTCSELWAAAQPEALAALCAGLMRAGERCDDGGRRQELVQVLSQSQWLGQRSAIALGRQFNDGTGSSRDLLHFNVYHANLAHSPNPAEGAWFLSQFSRWGWSVFPSNRQELLGQVYRTDLCDAGLERAGYAPLRPSRQPFSLGDGIAFDQDDPLAYLQQLPGGVLPPVRPVELPATSAGPACPLVTP